MSILPLLLLLLTSPTIALTLTRTPYCLSPEAIPPESVPMPRPADCTALAATLRATPGAATRRRFPHHPRLLARAGTCQAYTTVPTGGALASLDAVAAVVEEVGGECLLNDELPFVGGVLNIGAQDRGDYFYVWVTGIWDPDSAEVGGGNWTGNRTEAGDGGVGGRVDVT